MKLKKIVSLMLAGVMAVSMLAGCGNNSGNDNKGESEGETSTVASCSTELRSALSGAARSVVTAVSDSKLDSALKKAVDTYFTDNDYNYALNFAVQDLTDANKIYKNLVETMEAKKAIDELTTANDKTTTAVKLYVVNSTVSDSYALEQVADIITGAIANLADESADKENSYKYTISASIVTRSTERMNTAVGVKYIAVAVTQNVTAVA